MEIVVTSFCLFAVLLWLGVLFMPGVPWSTKEVLNVVSVDKEQSLSDVTVVIPARNEGKHISDVLSSLLRQGKELRIILVDDCSTDDTAEVAKKVAGENITILSGKPLPQGWTGKLWALEQGWRLVKTPLILLMDADIFLEPGILKVLREKMKRDRLQFISLMALLHTENFWEKLLMPAFVFFFKLLYPFRLSNSTSSKVAAAAGGCIMMESKLLHEIGGFRHLCEELIDDCALAKKLKTRGFKIWIGLTHAVKSLREYNDLESIWNMVARTAFTQLRYSVFLLILCTIILLTMFFIPIINLMFVFSGRGCLAIIAVICMCITYTPIVRFYCLPVWWIFTLPFAAALFLGMTWSSALRYWRGVKSQWKGRIYCK